MGRFCLDLDLTESLGLWLALCERERDDSVLAVTTSLKSYLYDRLSVEEMENPEGTYARLLRSAPSMEGRA